MALWDPEAAGNAAIYLRLDNLKLIDIRNAPFEGKTSVWIPVSVGAQGRFAAFLFLYSESGFQTTKRVVYRGATRP